MFGLNGKVALVAGGAGYLALPCCKGLLEHGARVAIADLDEERLVNAMNETADIAGKDKVTTLRFDISDEASVRQVVADTLAHFGRLDVMVNATFFGTAKSAEEVSVEDFDRANRINITGSFVLAREAARAMTDGGSIIQYASMYGVVAPEPRVYHAPMNPNPIEYGAGKAAIIQMTRYLAAHYGPRNIRVNAIMPGTFPWASTQEAHPEFTGRLAARTMLGRVGRRGETAGAVVFLASDEAAYITGHLLRIDGGWTAW